MGYAWEESETFRVNEESEQFPMGNGHLQHTAITEHDNEWG